MRADLHFASMNVRQGIDSFRKLKCPRQYLKANRIRLYRAAVLTSKPRRPKGRETNLSRSGQFQASCLQFEILSPRAFPPDRDGKESY